MHCWMWGATGAFCIEFQDQQWDGYIIDPDPSGAFTVKHGVNFTCGYLAMESFENKFDLVSLIFVLEHLANPRSMLELISQIIYKEGIVNVEVPDEIAFIKKESEDDIFNSCHLFMFNPESLSQLLQQAGLKVLKIDRMQTKRGHLALRCLASKL